MTAPLVRLWWRLTWRLRTPCTTWPCKRCNKAGRTSWRSREWHQWRRDRRLRIAKRLIVAAVILAGATWAGVAR